MNARCGSLAAVADCPWLLRRATPEDGTFMADMLVEAVNWSSEWKNFAQQLYASEGYQIVDSSDADSDTMVKDLAAGPSGASRGPG